MPDTTLLAQDLVYESWYHDKASAPSGSEYYDAESLLGSLKSGLSSFASASASGLAQGASFFSSSITGREFILYLQSFFISTQFIFGQFSRELAERPSLSYCTVLFLPADFEKYQVETEF